MLRIGLTGSIAAGKSAVTHVLRQRGVPVIDADALSRDVVAPGEPGVLAVSRRFGAGVLRADGSLDRAAVAKIVFADAQARRDLEAILHPLVLDRMWARFAELERDGHPIAVVDAALLIESGVYREVDRVWLVVCDDAIRLQRLMARDGMTEEQAHLRMDSQMPQHEKRRHADAVIDNSGDPIDTERQVLALLCAAGDRV